MLKPPHSSVIPCSCHTMIIVMPRCPKATRCSCPCQPKLKPSRYSGHPAPMPSPAPCFNPLLPTLFHDLVVSKPLHPKSKAAYAHGIPCQCQDISSRDRAIQLLTAHYSHVIPILPFRAHGMPSHATPSHATPYHGMRR